MVGTMSSVFMACVAGGCGGPPATPATKPALVVVSPQVAKQAQQLFRMRCAPCHGPAGKGDGPAAPALKPKPRDFSMASWQRAIVDSEIERAILDGGVALGMSPVMPAHPDLYGRPQLVIALRQMIRGFAGQ